MVLADLITQLMTDDELAASRVGVVPATSETTPWITSKVAETVVVHPSGAGGAEPVCELVVADAGSDTVAVLPVAISRLARDGILVAAVPPDIAVEAARAATALGAEWSALLTDDTADRHYLVAAVGMHPAELGPLVADHVVYEPNSACVHVPQNRADRARRRTIRREGRTRLLTLTQRLRDEHGVAISRVVEAVEALVGDRRTDLNSPGARPAIFAMPGITAEAWPVPARSPRLMRLLGSCERHGAGVRAELRALVESRTFGTEVQNAYNVDKFQMTDPHGWTSITLFDEGRPTDDLPVACRSTRALLDEMAPHISGEVVLLRVAPMTALPPHYDDNDYQQTAHIGLTIPPRCGIRVGGETRTWDEGKPLVFSPVFLHEVWNRSDQARDVLLIDTWHMDLTDAEIEALTLVRRELRAMREERNSRLPVT
jgi:hypothetical protein